MLQSQLQSNLTQSSHKIPKNSSFICSKIDELKKVTSFLLFVCFICFFSCAKRGRPTGGPKDIDPPLMVVADPPYETTNFNTNEIEIEFNEYVKLKDINKQLIVSPPQKNRPLITPQSTASRYLTIKILDTLIPNTTYTFDFGNSVEDNNEGNKLERFKYVFSTGSYIDSLTLEGTVKNAYKEEKAKNIKMLLYRIDSTYSDSTVYKRKPDYVTSTLDSFAYRFTNLKDGKYSLFALEDASDDYIFDPKRDRIGFRNKPVVLPRDTVIEDIIPIFKSIIPYKFKIAKESKKGKIIFGYEGFSRDLEIDLLSDVPEDFKTVTFYEKGKDTLNFWHSSIERDSLVFKIRSKSEIDTVVVKLRKKKLDSLEISLPTSTYLNFKDTLFLTSNNPIINIDSTKITLINSDSIKIAYRPFLSSVEKKVGFVFDKKLNTNYHLSILPEAFADIFDQKNDSLRYDFKTKGLEKYGDISFNVTNPQNIPVIFELTHSKEILEERKVIKNSGTISFNYLDPKKYKVRMIYDVNDNGKWDTGDVLKKTQPEKIVYYSEEINVRANFSVVESITIKN